MGSLSWFLILAD